MTRLARGSSPEVCLVTATPPGHVGFTARINAGVETLDAHWATDTAFQQIQPQRAETVFLRRHQPIRVPRALP